MANPMKDGEIREVWGSGSKPYVLKCIGGLNSCSCPAWRNQSKPIDQRTCKHLRKECGDAYEAARIGGAPPPLAVSMSCSVKPATLPIGVDAPQCACHQGGTCEQCRTAQAKTGAESPEDIVAQVMGVKPTMRSPEPQETPVSLKGDGIERNKSKRINSYGGFVPFSDQEICIITAEEEARKGRKLRQDEKADLFGPPVLLANNLEDDFDPTGWLESEKADGVRFYYNGEVFISRQGNVYQAPAWFTSSLPKIPLDGEGYMGRRKFQQTISVVKRQNGGDEWKKIKFIIFDAPAHGGTFEQRLAYLETLSFGAYASVHPHRICTDRAEMEKHLLEIEALGGEGLMYRKPGSLYESRRSSTLLKAKPFKNDAEAEVIGYEPGKKANKGKTGGLIVRMPNGKTFSVGSGLTAKDRENPPAIGTTITYRFAGTTDDGLPKCASFLRVRPEE